MQIQEAHREQDPNCCEWGIPVKTERTAKETTRDIIT